MARRKAKALMTTVIGSHKVRRPFRGGAITFTYTLYSDGRVRVASDRGREWWAGRIKDEDNWTVAFMMNALDPTTPGPGMFV